jgi:3-deoxy-D-manno-octulosonate 8-phosphate phosphatase (KDO 8-P phosphatase)
MYKHLSPDLQQTLSGIRLVITDVDGVHTNDKVGIGIATNGEPVETYWFHTGDGIVVKECLRHDLPVVMMSGRSSPVVVHRAKALGARFLHGIADKVGAAQTLMAEMGLDWHHVLFIGNDIQDIALLRLAGFSAAPADGAEEAKAVAKHVTEKRGGEGVVREVLQALLEAKGHWEKIISRDRTLG